MNFAKPLSSLLLGMSMFAGVSLSHAALLGLTASEPTIDFGGSGVISYDANTGLVEISGSPATLFQTDPFIFGDILGTGVEDEKMVLIKFYVNAAGQYASGVDGPDLIVQGAVDTNFDGTADYSGNLLEAELAQFGFADGIAGASDNFDMRFNAVGGSLAPLYGSNEIAAVVSSEPSTEYTTPFANSFLTSFTGQAKGTIGATGVIQTAACSLKVDAFCSVDGGPNKTKCRIKTSKSAKHWEYADVNFHGHACRRPVYGMHGNPPPAWANRYPSTDVKFSYVLTNTGTTPVSGLIVADSFETPATGVPATLNPGQSVTLVRTEKLTEGLEDTVTVLGQYSTATCGANDIVVIKDKLRDRQKHDEDDFKDKGKR
jgi:hypothetical protein